METDYGVLARIPEHISIKNFEYIFIYNYHLVIEI